MKAIVERVRRGRAFELQEIDISGNPELEGRYGTEIPVLELDGRKIAKYRVDEASLIRMIESRR
jgi:hypothetical protein